MKTWSRQQRHYKEPDFLALSSDKSVLTGIEKLGCRTQVKPSGQRVVSNRKVLALLVKIVSYRSRACRAANATKRLFAPLASIEKLVKNFADKAINIGTM